MEKKLNIFGIFRKRLESEFLGVEKKKVLVTAILVPIPFIISLALYFFTVQSTIVIAVLSLGLVAAFTPYLFFGFLEVQEIISAESGYPNFLNDLAQGVASGMTIPQAVQVASEAKYGVLSKYVQKLHTWMTWGIPFPEAWSKFTKLLQRSDLIKRVNGIIAESFIAGGDIGAVLATLTTDVTLLKRIESDKKAMAQQNIVIMYLIYFIFLGIIIGLYKILVPILYVQRIGVFGGISLRPADLITTDYFKTLFFLMTVIQSASIGFMAGQIVEERLVAGFKHVIIMVSLGAFIFFAFIFPAGLTAQAEIFPERPGYGQTVVITGSLFFESEPASGANVEILLPSKEVVLVFTDGLGEFQTTFPAPTQEGTYPITVTINYKGETALIARSITVSS